MIVILFYFIQTLLRTIASSISMAYAWHLVTAKVSIQIDTLSQCVEDMGLNILIIGFVHIFNIEHEQVNSASKQTIIA